MQNLLRKQLGEVFALCRNPKVLACAMRAKLELGLPIRETYQQLTDYEPMMDWDGLLNAKAFDFAHDVLGIATDRPFMPRYQHTARWNVPA